MCVLLWSAMNIFGKLYTEYILERIMVILREYRGMKMKLSAENVGKIEYESTEKFRKWPLLFNKRGEK